MNRNNEVRWAGRVYRQASPDGGDPGGGGDPPAGDPPAGDPPAGDPPAGDPPAGDPPAGDPPAGDPPESWRANLAGENEDYAKRLERYSTPEAFIESAFQAHDKIRAGELQHGLPQDATEDQVKEYRETNGIPLDGKYEVKLESGPLNETDLELLEGVFAKGTEHNISGAAMDEMLGAYFADRDKMIESMAQQDGLDKQEFTRQMKETWGGDYEINMNRATNRFNLLPEAVRDEIQGATMPNGMKITNNPQFMSWLVNMDREISPLPPLPGATESTLADANKIIEAGKLRMRDDSVAWHRDAKAQAEFQAALDMVDKAHGSQ